MRGNILMRFVVVICGLVLCLWGIWNAGAAGLSKLFSVYARTTGLIAPAERATLLSPSDPEAHFARALLLRNKGALAEAVTEYERAVALRPRDYVLWLELALARDAANDGEGALAACEQAVRLAPFYGRTHWLLGNLLYRAGHREEAFTELRRAASSDQRFVPNLIDLAWGTYAGDALAVERTVQPQTDATRIALASYFARKGKLDEAISLFRAAAGAGKEERRAFLKELLAARRFKEASEVWFLNRQESGRESKVALNTILEPGFEGAINLNEPGFGWHQSAGVENVYVSLDTNSPRAGARSLRIEFSGNSNPPDSIISQIVLVEPNTRYSLHFAARTEQVITGGLPQITVSEAAASEDYRLMGAIPLPPTADSWHDYSMELTTGKETEAIIIRVNRQSCSSSPCPAYGRVWLDDFSLQRQTVSPH